MTLLKFLVIFGLFALLLLLVYSRVYPYLQALRKILTAARTFTESGNTAEREVSRTDRRLVRCVGCGTWVPAERSIGTGTGGAVYCSRECIEKQSAEENRKLAG